MAIEETVLTLVASYHIITENVLLNTILGWSLKQGTPLLGRRGESERGEILSSALTST